MVCQNKGLFCLLLLAMSVTEFVWHAHANGHHKHGHHKHVHHGRRVLCGPKPVPVRVAPLPSPWTRFGTRTYQYFRISMDWASAEKYCLNLGANLVSIHSEAEYQHVKALIRAQDPREGPTWIGLSCCEKRSEWLWSDGSKLVFTKWNAGEPNYLPGECCTHMNWSGERNWNDIPCNQNYPFVCVKKA